MNHSDLARMARETLARLDRQLEGIERSREMPGSGELDSVDRLFDELSDRLDDLWSACVEEDEEEEED
jgi:hypothetical protein